MIRPSSISLQYHHICFPPIVDIRNPPVLLHEGQFQAPKLFLRLSLSLPLFADVPDSHMPEVFAHQTIESLQVGFRLTNPFQQPC